MEHGVWDPWSGSIVFDIEHLRKGVDNGEYLKHPWQQAYNFTPRAAFARPIA